MSWLDLIQTELILASTELLGADHNWTQLSLAESNHTDFFLNWTDEPYILPLCFWFSWSKRFELLAESCFVLILFWELESDKRLAWAGV